MVGAVLTKKALLLLAMLDHPYILLQAGVFLFVYSIAT
jgi:hypothetical protein